MSLHVRRSLRARRAALAVAAWMALRPAAGASRVPPEPELLAVQLGGTVYEDVNGDSGLGDAVPAVSVTVTLYKDGGDGVPNGADDTLVGTTATDGSGVYAFINVAPGNYWIVADSKTVPTSAGLNYGFGQGDIWAEQTYGGAGARCGNGAGGVTVRATAGACFGGLRGTVSDDASSLATAEHVIGATVGAANVGGEDFGFSFNVMTNAAGGDAADDDGANPRTVQGSFRQFLQNAAAIAGGNALRFVPAVATNAAGGGGAWWRIGVTSPLPVLSDGATTIDGTAYSLTDGTTVRDDNPGSLGAAGTVGVDALALSQVNKPELEISDTRSTAVVPIGLDLQADGDTIRKIAIYGFGNATDNDGSANIRVGALADSTLIELSLIGTLPSSFSDPGAASRTAADGIRSTGGDSGIVRNDLIGFSAGAGISLQNGSSGWLIEKNEIRRNAVGKGHLAGIELGASSASATVRQNLITDHDGPGIDTPASAGGHVIQNDTITGNGVGADPDGDAQPVVTAGIRISVNGSTIDRNVLSVNYGAGVMVAPSADDLTITKNSVFDNGTVNRRTGPPVSGEIGIDLLSATDNPAHGNGASTPPYVTLNDNGDADTGADGLLNAPVITTAWINGANLIVNGFSRPATTIEFFIVTADPTGFGEGKTYAFTATEASGSDSDSGTGTYGPGAINGIAQGTDTTARFTFTVPVPAGVSNGTKLTATARTTTGATSEFGGNVTVAAGSYVRGSIYDDLNANGVLNAGEPGIGSGAFVKLISAGSVIQVVTADPLTGAYTFIAVPNGAYTVIVDDNASTADTTATAPANWTFATPATGSLAITVASADLAGKDLGLTYTAACVCGYGDGLFTLTTIATDGNMSDWAAVLADKDNNSCDATDATDRDAPVQSTGRNLARTAVTMDATYFYMYTARSGSTSNTQTFIYYCDANFDNKIEQGEPVVVASWHGSNQSVDLQLWSYNAVAPGGDPIVDVNGYSDGYHLPGTLTLLRSLPVGDGHGDVTGNQMEWRIKWTDLGVPAFSGIHWHSSDTNASPGSGGLPAQIDDNMGGCGGLCPGTNAFSALTISPHSQMPVAPIVYVPHTVTNNGNTTDTFKVASTYSGPWVPTSITYYKDNGVVGTYEPGIDTLLTDTNNDTFIDTGPIAMNGTLNILVAVATPGPPAAGTDNIVTTLTSALTGCGLGPTATASVTDPITLPSADLRVTKSDGRTAAAPGSTLTYTIQVTNAGPDAESGATVVDTLPPAVFNVAGTTWTCAITTGTGACGAASGTGNLNTTVNLNSGAVATYTVVAPILTGATGTITNTATATVPATVTDPAPGNNSGTDNDTVLAPQSDLRITKTDGVTSAAPGTNLTYTITVTNVGPSDATAASVADTLSPTWFNAAGATWTCAVTSGTGSCGAASGTGNLATTVSLSVGAVATYTIVAPILASATGTITNTATVGSPAGNTDPFPSNNSASDTNTALTPSGDLTITKSDGVTTYIPGNPVTYTIVVGNTGPSNIAGATVTDAVMALSQVASASWTCVAAGGATCNAGPVAGNIADTINLPVGGTATYTLVATTKAGASGAMANTASVASPAGSSDPAPGNNTATDTDTSGAGISDLSITKSDGVATYVAGGSVTYTITVGNAGPSDATGATITDLMTALPQVASATWTCVDAGGATCNPGPVTGDITDTVNIPVGGTLTYTLAVTTKSSATGNLVNTATAAVASGGSDPAPGNNTAADTDTPTHVADLSITKSDGALSYLAGGSTTYTIVVSNAGPSDATGATVADVIASLPQVQSASWTCAGAGGGSCTAGPVAGDINDTVNVPKGGTVTYTLTATLKASASGNLVNTASVAAPAGTTDPGAGNNSATDTDTPAARISDMSITKSDGVASYTAGGSVTYTIVVGNAGPSDATGATVSDAVTALPQVASASWTCVAAGGATCTAGPVAGDINDSVNVPVGGTLTYTLSVTTKSGASGSLVNVANVTPPSGTADPGPGPNSATDTDTEARVADLSVTKSDGVATYTAGGAVTYTIVVSNAGPSDAVGATVSDHTTALPQVAGESWTCVATPGSSCTAGPVADDIADVVTVAKGGTLTYTFTVQTKPGATGNLVNSVTVAPAAGTTDPGPGVDTATDTDTEARVTDLSITKSDGVASYTAGGSVSYTIVVSNAGPSDALGAKVTDLVTALPQVASAHWTCAGASGGTCTAGPVVGDINDTVNVPVGGTVTYTLVATTKSSASGNLVNTATVAPAAGSSDPNPGGNSATDTDTETRTADLSVTKTDGVTTYTAGGSVTYTIVASNAGPSDVTGATVSDAVTALPQVASASWTCVAAGGATCAAASGSGDINATDNIPVGGTVTYTLTVVTKPNAVGNLVNTASVSTPAGTTDPAPGGDNATDSDSEVRVADLSITKSDGVAAYTPGGSVTYTMVVNNAGPSDATGATVSDAVLALPQVQGASWTCVGAGGATCTAGPVSGNINDVVNVPKGGSLTYTLSVAIKSSASGNLVNTASVAPPAGETDPGPGPDSATDTDTESRVADLSIVKSDGVASYTAGGTVTYTIDVSNAGPSDAVGATVTDAVLALPQVASATWTCVGAGGATCTAGPVSGNINDTVNVPAGGSLTYTLTVTTKSSAAGNLVNAASIADPSGTSDPTPGNDSATDSDTEIRSADVTITKSDGVTSYTAGGAVTYTIVVGNNGPSDVTGATVADAVMALPQVASASWTCVGANGATCAAGPVAGNIADTVNVPVGGTLTYTLAVTTKPSASGSLVNAATVADPAGTGDPTPANNSATDTDTEARTADLSITKSDGVATYTAGGTVTYTIVVGNAGPSNAIGATVIDAVMALPQVASASWTCVAAGGATCAAGPVAGNVNDTINVPVGGTATYTLAVTTKASASGNLVNAASVAPPAGTTDPAAGNDAATDTDTETRTADLAITKSDAVASYTAGGSVTYTIVVSNAGPSDAIGATVTDAVLALPQVASASWTCVAAGGATCAAGPVAGNINDTINVPVGGTATYTLVVTTKPSASGNLVNTATVADPSGTTDPAPANDAATDTDTETRTADLSITKTDGVATYTAGGSVTYTIVVGNTGPSDAVGAVVTDAVLALAQVASASWTCAGANGAVCNVGSAVGNINDTVNLPVGGTLTYTLTAITKSNAAGNLVNTATVADPAGTTDPTPANDSATDTDTPTRTADLTITKSDGAVSYLAGGTVTYTIVVSNAGPSDAVGATVTDAVLALPQVASASWTCVGAGGATCTAGPSAGNINDTINVPAGGSATYTLVVPIKPGATGNLVNTATVADPSGTTDPTPANDTATDSDTPASRVSDMSVTKTDGVASYTAGGTVTYTIVVSNAGPSDANGATVADAVMALPQVASASWTCVGAGGATCTAGPVAGNINDTVDVPVGGTLTYTLTTTLKSGASGNLVNTATITPPAGTADPGPGPNSATDTDTEARTADVAITKTDGVATYTAGSATTYTIIVSNAGPSDAVGATVTDAVLALPQVASASWTCVAAGGGTCSAGPVAGNINDTVDVPKGATLTYTLVATTKAGASGNLVNTATIADPAGTTDPVAGNDSASDTDTETRTADLSIAKSDAVATYTAGGTVTYTIVVSNAGPSDAVGATVTDAVLALPQVASASWTCAGTGGATCTAGPTAGNINDTINVPAGGTATYTLVVTTKASASGNLVNTATAADPSGTSDPTPGNDTATDTDTETRTADLSITKSDGVASYVAGSAVTYTIVVGNAGPSDAIGATVTDNVLALAQVASASWTCVGAGGATCAAGPVAGNIADTVNVPVGGTATYTLVTTTKPAASGNLVNTATVADPPGTTDPTPANDTATDTDTETRTADLSITKSDGVASYVAGSAVTYTVVVGNAGPSDAIGATVTDAVTALPQIASASWTCVGAGGATCTAGPVAGNLSDTVNVPKGGTLTYTLIATTKSAASGNLVNTATVAPPSGTTDPAAGNDTATDTDTETRTADLAVTKSDGVASYVAGAAVTYTIVVSNAGPSDGVGATVTDAVAALPQVASASWTCVAIGGATCAAGPVAGNIADTVNVPKGGTLTYTLTVQTKPGAAGNLVNTVTVADPAGTTDPTAANNAATDTDTETRAADLSITKSDGVASYVAGNPVTYTIVVTNAGPSDAIGATVTDAIAGLPQIASASWTCAGAGGATCTAGPVAGNIADTVNVPKGGTLTYTLVAQTKAAASGDLVNTATVAPPAGTTDPGPAPDSATDTDVAASRISDLAITKTDGVASYVAGGSVTYTIVVSNAGPSDAVGATVTDAVLALPQVAGASWTCVAAGGGSCAAGPVAGNINDTVNVPVGATLTYTLVVTTKSSASGNLVNAASVAPAAGTSDPAPGNDTATDTDTETRTADVSITKTDGVATYTAGGTVTYTIVVGNAGPSDAVGATVTDNVLALPQVASASWTCVGAGGATCTAGPVAGNIADTANVPKGGTATYTLTVTTKPSAAGNLVNTATVGLPAGTTDPAPANDTATDTDTEVRAADLSITKTDGAASYTAGSPVTYTIVVGNAGPSDATGAVVTDNVLAQAQVASASWTCVAAGGATCAAGPVAGNISDTINVPKGGTATYTLTALLKSSATGNLVNTATVAPPSGTTDPTAANDTATDTDTESRTADLSITKTDGAATYTAGTVVPYTIVVTNAGPSDAIGAIVSDPVLALPQVLGASWTCAATGGATCAAGPVAGNINDTVNIPVGGTLTYTLSAVTRSSASGNLVNTATVAPPAGTTDPAPAGNTATDTDTATRAADLSITKTDGVAAYTAGSPVTYSLVVTNAGPSDAIGATVTDAVTALPQVQGASWTCVATGGATCAAGPVAGNINDTVNVPVGGTLTYTLVTQTKPSASGNLVNTATVAPAAGTTDPAPAGNTATDTDTGNRTADLAIAKTDGVASYVAGSPVTYTITVTNAGPSDATGATVTDAVLALPQVASASWTCVASGGASCSAGPISGNINDTVNVPVGGTLTYTLAVTTKSSASGNLVNTATIAPASGTTDPAPANDTATDTDTAAGRVSDLSVTKTDGVASYVAGTSVTYTIVVGNAGPSDAAGATVTDAVLALPQVASASWTCVGANGATCTAGPVAGNINDTVNVPVGGTLTYSLQVTTRSSAAGDLVNAASVAVAAGSTDPGAANNTATDTDTAAGRVSDLSITKTDGAASYSAGGTTTYTIVVGNTGPSDAVGATVSDALAALPQVASDTWTCVGTGGATCTAGPVTGNINDTVNVPVGGSLTYTVVAALRSNAAGNLVNTASVAPAAGASDPGAGNNAATDTDTPGPRSTDLSITKTDNVTTVTAGQPLTYVIRVGNAGPAEALNAAIADTLDPTKLDVANAAWTCAITTPPGVCHNPNGTGNLVATVDLDVGAVATFTVVVPVLVSATGTITNTATVTPVAGSVDPNAANNSATDGDTQIGAFVDLSLTKAVDNATPNVNANVVFAITVSNAAGYRPATGVVVTDLLPNGYAYVGDDGAGAYVPATGVWSVGTVNAGTSKVLHITARVLGSGTYLNAAEVTAADQPDVNDTYGNGQGTDYGTAAVTPRGTDAVVAITPQSVPGDTLALSVTDADRNADPAVADTITVTVVNNATGETETRTLTETGPNTGVFAGTMPTVGAPTAGANNDGTLVTRIGDTVTLSYLDTFTTTGTPATRTATGVVTGKILRITKTAADEFTVVGSFVPYALRVENLTTLALAAASVSDNIPAGFKLVPESVRLVRAGPDGRLGSPDDVATPLTSAGSRPVDLGPFALAPSEIVIIRYVLRVGSGVAQGRHENVATPLVASNVAGDPASASVTVVADPTFDQATIIGKVFDDLNANGRLDPDEPGVPKAMVALDNGTYVLTDAAGRFHFPAVDPGQRMIKLNVLSLPPGTVSSGEDSAILTLTPGLIAKANFGVILAKHQAATEDRQIPALAIASRTDTMPIDIQGSAEALTAIVNGTSIKIATSDARLRVEPLDDAITLKGGALDGPVRFDLGGDSGADAASWTLSVENGAGEVVKRFDGNGAPPASVTWDGRTDAGAQVTAGEVYQYHLEVRGHDGSVAGSPIRLFGVNRKRTVSFQLSPDSFETAHAELSPKAKRMLKDVAAAFRQIPDEKIVIEGHTDSVGGDDYNMDLSKRRAVSAMRCLVDEYGLPESQFILRWYGKTRPIATNTQPEGRTMNRRVTINADKDEVDNSRPVAPFHAEPSVTINGAAVPVGPMGRFDGQVDDPAAGKVDIAMTDSRGRAARVVVAVPSLTIGAPHGDLTIARGASSGGCLAAADGSSATVKCALAGQTDPGNSVEIDGHDVAVSPDGAFTAPVTLPAGSDTIGIVVRNPQGFERIANLEAQVSERDADGKMHVITQPVPTVTVNLPPQGMHVKAQMISLAGATEPGNHIEIDGQPVDVDETGHFERDVELKPGKNHLTVKVTDPHGRVGVLERDVEVVKNELFLMAFADGVYGKMQSKGLVEAAGLDKNDNYYSNGRIAYYLKGVIAGKYLITSAFDSGNTDQSSAFRGLDPETSRRLLTNLDPDKIYPVYGDDSTIVYDAESQGKFYLALDSDEIHLVIGNYPLSLNDTELAAYRRTLYGGRFTYQSAAKTAYGDPDTRVIVFGAQERNAHMRDEIEATGGSLYYMSHRDVVEGSEEVTIIVRDVNTGLLLSSQRQQRNIDYTIKYDEGRIVFNRPISSVVDSGSLISPNILSGHPVRVQIDYESVSTSADKTASGARAQQHLGDHVAIGGTYVKDELDSGRHELAGADAEVKIGQATRFTAEYATSTGVDSIAQVSADGGITYSPVAITGPQNGSAWKATAEVDVGEWFRKPGLYNVRAYYKKLDPGFFASGTFLEQGTEKTGVAADLRFGAKDTLQMRFDHEDLTGALLPTAAAQTSIGSLQWNHTSTRWGISGELQSNDSKTAAGASVTKTGLAAVRLWTKLTEKISGYLQHQQTLTGPANDQTTAGLTFQASSWIAFDVKATDGSIGRSAQAGAVVKVGESDVYVTQRAAEDLAGRKNTTILGARSPLSPNTKIYGEYQWEDADAGARKTSLLGMQRKWDLMRGLKFVASAEAANVRSGAIDTNRTAISGQVSYVPSDRLTTLARTEARWEKSDHDHFQLFALVQADYKLNEALKLLASYRYSKTTDKLTDLLEAKFDERTLGIAYRPVKNDRFNAIARYTHLFELNPQALAGAIRSERTMDVLSGEGIYDFGNGVEWVTKLAARRQQDVLDDAFPVTSTLFLGIQRVNVSIRNPIWLGVEYRILAQREAQDRKQGALLELMWKLYKNFRIGTGYNFTDFSDNEFSTNDYRVHGWFVRAQARF